MRLSDTSGVLLVLAGLVVCCQAAARRDPGQCPRCPSGIPETAPAPGDFAFYFLVRWGDLDHQRIAASTVHIHQWQRLCTFSRFAPRCRPRALFIVPLSTMSSRHCLVCCELQGRLQMRKAVCMQAVARWVLLQAAGMLYHSQTVSSPSRVPRDGYPICCTICSLKHSITWGAAPASRWVLPPSVWMHCVRETSGDPVPGWPASLRNLTHSVKVKSWACWYSPGWHPQECWIHAAWSLAQPGQLLPKRLPRALQPKRRLWHLQRQEHQKQHAHLHDPKLAQLHHWWDSCDGPTYLQDQFCLHLSQGREAWKAICANSCLAHGHAFCITQAWFPNRNRYPTEPLILRLCCLWLHLVEVLVLDYRMRSPCMGSVKHAGSDTARYLKHCLAWSACWYSSTSIFWFKFTMSPLLAACVPNPFLLVRYWLRRATCHLLHAKFWIAVCSQRMLLGARMGLPWLVQRPLPTRLLPGDPEPAFPVRHLGGCSQITGSCTFLHGFSCLCGSVLWPRMGILPHCFLQVLLGMLHCCNWSGDIDMSASFEVLPLHPF